MANRHDDPTGIRGSPEGVLLTVHVQPNAARTEYAGPHGDALKFRIAAPPIDGAANEALCCFLAERFGISRRVVELQTGLSARRKRLLLRGLSSRRVRDVLNLRPASPTSA